MAACFTLLFVCEDGEKVGFKVDEVYGDLEKSTYNKKS